MREGLRLPGICYGAEGKHDTALGQLLYSIWVTTKQNKTKQDKTQHNTPNLNRLLKYISHTDCLLGPFFLLPISPLVHKVWATCSHKIVFLHWSRGKQCTSPKSWRSAFQILQAIFGDYLCINVSHEILPISKFYSFFNLRAYWNVLRWTLNFTGIYL